MPRHAKGPRLYLRDREGRPPVYVIKDGGREHSTGCGPERRAEAETALAEYLAKTRLAIVRDGDPAAILIADILTYYAEERAPSLASPELVGYLMEPLVAYAGTTTCDRIGGPWCRRYVERRTQGKIGKRAVSESTARRELEHLNAALRFAFRERKLAYPPPVTLPPQRGRREEWLSRDQVAALVRAAWNARDKSTKRPHLRHVARFILTAFYTGSRSGAVLASSFVAAADRSFVDLESGLFYRLAQGRARTNKRQPPVPLPTGLWAHMRRWHAAGAEWIVTERGRPIASIDRGFASVVALSGITDRATPHTLRHSFVTLALQGGLSTYKVAEMAGMSANMVEKVYGHHAANRREEITAALKRGHNGGKTIPKPGKFTVTR